jgi:hypothetical protein
LDGLKCRVGGEMEETKKTCIYTKKKFADAAGEHILQNFLGARWVSNKICCNEVQEQFGETIDLALEQGLREFRNLLGAKGGRGGDGPSLKNVEDSKGKKYHIQPGGTPYLAEPIIATRHVSADVYELSIKLGGREQLGWAISKFREQFPNVSLDLDKLESQLTSHKQYLDDRIHLRTGIGGCDYFRGLLKAAFNLLGTNNPSIACNTCFDDLRTFVLMGIGESKNYVRWFANNDRLHISTLGLFDHFIGIYTDGSNVDGIVQFFGGISHIIRLTNSYCGPEFQFGYQVNPLRDTNPAETRTPYFDPKKLPQFDDGYAEPVEEVLQIYRDMFSRFLTNHSDIATEKEMTRIVDKVLAPYEGEMLSSEIVNELVEEVLKFMVTRIKKD